MLSYIEKICKKIIHKTWSLFLNGLLTLLPITITVTVFTFSFKLLKSWLEPVNTLPLHLPIWIPHAEVFFAFIFILLIGLVLKSFVLQSIIKTVEHILFKVPLIRPVYSGIKQLVHAFNPHDTVSFKKIVLVEFPRTGIYSIGFLTSEVSPLITKNTTKKIYSIFIPTTPNPTSGFCVLIPEEAITVIDLTHQEAMALIISGGIVQPERLNSKNNSVEC